MDGILRLSLLRSEESLSALFPKYGHGLLETADGPDVIRPGSEGAFLSHSRTYNVRATPSLGGGMCNRQALQKASSREE
jgi:hypothetical protein